MRRKTGSTSTRSRGTSSSRASGDARSPSTTRERCRPCRRLPASPPSRRTGAHVFDPEPGSLRRHEVPAWFHDAKLGIFVHWTLASVPAWAPDEGALPELARDHF
ncbi:MAG: alpha-L-fucosidase, partial [Deltaproteobacteria bacterium]|nr:alpha-L-fucosidase [Deltaproteobacteria bacterium]